MQLWARTQQSFLTRVLAGSAASALLAAGALAAAPAQAQSVSQDGLTHREFYAPPAELPQEPGQLVKAEPMGMIAQGIPGVWNADAERIMYTSVGASGEIVPVTGVYLKNNRPPLGGGPRPLAIIAPGTHGAGDQCAPSRAMEYGVNFATDTMSASTGFEAISAWALLDRGFDVVVTDYEGLGTPGQHTYVNNVAEAHAVLDAGRAAIAHSDGHLAADAPVVVTGYSQGGGAAARTAEIESTYAPELNIRGVNVGAPPVNLAATLSEIDGSLIVGAVGYALNSFLATNPELLPLLEEHLNEAGVAAVERTANQCIGDSILTDAMRSTAQWTKSGQPAQDVLLNIPEARAVIDSQRIGDAAPQVPVRLQGNVNDDVIPFQPIQEVGGAWCAAGSDVQFIAEGTPPIFPGMAINHGLPYLTHVTEGNNYLVDRVLGVPAPSNCQA